ncbi:MAG: histidinol-phosphate transaminase [Myxococcota bacterium]
MKLTCVDRVAQIRAYSVPKSGVPCDLRLDGNEGRKPDGRWAQPLGSPEVARQYPKLTALQERLAARHGVAAEQVLVTAGADEALDRACRAMLDESRGLVLPLPTFEMLHTYAKLTGARIAEIAWPGGAYPEAAVLEAIDERTVAVAMVSPNNPTGAVATAENLARVAAAAPLVLLDHAYVEFADHDLSARALELGNVIVFRTLSKAWGLAGLRIGYAVGPSEPIGWMRRVGLPYPVSGPSLHVALDQLDRSVAEVDAFVTAVRSRRQVLEARLQTQGVALEPSQANFVFLRHPGADALREGLAQHGIAVRGWPGHPVLADGLRITVPADDASQQRLLAALDAVLAVA